MLRRQPAALGVRHDPPFGDRQQGIVGLVVVGRLEEGLVRRDDRQAFTIGQRDEIGLDEPFLLEPVALDLDVELGSEGLLERSRRARASSRRPVRNAQSSGPVNPPVRAMRPSQYSASTADERRGESPSGTSK